MTPICILTAGYGGRLQKYTKYTNKSLLPIGDKPVISHIIDLFQHISDIEFIIAIGHNGKYIKDYCKIAHKDQKITYVEVDNIDIGPGYSLSQCREFLQQSFYLICCDCLIHGEIPNLDKDWIGLSGVDDTTIWSTAEINGNNKVIAFQNKSPHGYKNAYIGISGVKSHQTFWEQLDKYKNDHWEFVSAYYEPEKYDCLYGKFFDWQDTGTIDNYKHTQDIINPQITAKEIDDIDELTYKYNNKLIKQIFNKEKFNKKVSRSMFLTGKIPAMTDIGENTLAYSWIDGVDIYHANLNDNYNLVYDWCYKEFFSSINPYIDIFDDCLQFYKHKTLKRLKLFYDRFSNKYNNKTKQNNYDIVNHIDYNLLCNTQASIFHGDLTFSNIIFNRQTQKFCSIDWREGFGDGIPYGDMYYDLGKLYASISLPWISIEENKFDYIPPNMIIAKQQFEEWIKQHNYSLKKIQLLSGIVHLNMSPLYKNEGVCNLLYQKGLEEIKNAS